MRRDFLAAAYRFPRNSLPSALEALYFAIEMSTPCLLAMTHSRPSLCSTSIDSAPSANACPHRPSSSVVGLAICVKCERKILQDLAIPAGYKTTSRSLPATKSAALRLKRICNRTAHQFQRSFDLSGVMIQGDAQSRTGPLRVIAQPRSTIGDSADNP